MKGIVPVFSKRPQLGAYATLVIATLLVYFPAVGLIYDIEILNLDCKEAIFGEIEKIIRYKDLWKKLSCEAIRAIRAIRGKKLYFCVYS